MRSRLNYCNKLVIVFMVDYTVRLYGLFFLFSEKVPEGTPKKRKPAAKKAKALVVSLEDETAKKSEPLDSDSDDDFNPRKSRNAQSFESSQ